MKPTRVLLVDDHPLVRVAIRQLVEAVEGASVIAEADNGRDAVALALAHRPDLALMDISMRQLDGIEATQQICAQDPAARVIVLSMHATEDFVRRAMTAGAVGYIVKDSAPLELRLAIEAVCRGDIYLSPRISCQREMLQLIARAGR